MAKRIPIEQRIYRNMVVDANGCWRWTGAHHRTGYACMGVDKKSTFAHRVAYEHWVGPIPDGMHLDHLCRVRDCVNPSHLQPVTPRENLMRGYANAALNARKTHCKHGHAFDERNTCWRKSGGRRCRKCAANEQRARMARKMTTAS